MANNLIWCFFRKPSQVIFLFPPTNTWFWELPSWSGCYMCEQLLSGFSISELFNSCNMGVDLNELLFTHNLVLTHNNECHKTWAWNTKNTIIFWQLDGNLRSRICCWTTTYVLSWCPSLAHVSNRMTSFRDQWFGKYFEMWNFLISSCELPWSDGAGSYIKVSYALGSCLWLWLYSILEYYILDYSEMQRIIVSTHEFRMAIMSL